MDLFAFTRTRRILSSVSAAALLGFAAPAAAQVQSENLAALDLWSAPGRDSGLGGDLWRGASAELARSVLSDLGQKPLPPAMAELGRRVLATAGTAPEGAGSDVDLAAARVRALIALGDPAAANRILERTPQVEADEGLSRAQAETALLAGRDERACETGRRLQENRDGVWWLQLRAFCHLIAGDAPAAQLTMDLWRGQGGKNPAFDRLTTALAAADVSAKPSLADPLEYAISRRLQLDLAPALASAPPAVLAAVAQDTAATDAARREAAFHGLRAGSVSADEARSIYTPPAAVGAPAATEAAAPPAPAGDLAALAQTPGGEGEAALATLAALTADAATRQSAVRILLDRAKTAAEFQAVARLVRPRIAELVEAKVALDDPVLMASAAAAAGDAATAGAIRSGVEQGAVPGADPLGLALLDALIAAGGDGAGPTLDRVVERGSLGDARERARPQAAALLLAAGGAPMGPGARAQLAAFDVPAGKATPAQLAALAAAGRERLQGETALYALSVARQQPAGLAVADRAAIVRALVDAGLKEDATRIALEGLVAAQGR